MSYKADQQSIKAMIEAREVEENMKIMAELEDERRRCMLNTDWN